MLQTMPRQIRRLAAALLIALAAIGAGHARERQVDVALVLAIDSSSSVTMDDYYLQLEGYAAAFADPELWHAIAAGPEGAIAVALFEWSGSAQEDLQRFAAELALAPRLVLGGETAIGDALLYAASLLDGAPAASGRQVIDVSGDGAANRGTPPTFARAGIVARGVTINGLAVVSHEVDLEDYYAREVVGGAGSFVLSARDYVDFAGVIRRKLLRELGPVAAVPR